MDGTYDKAASRRWTLWLLAGLALAAALRVWLAMSYPFIFDEKYDWLLEASAIGWDEDAWNLPIRTARHGALSAYVMKLGALVLPESHLAWRWTSIAAGLLTIWGVAVLGRDRFGSAAGLAAAGFLVVCEYHIQLSSTANQMPIYLAASAWALIWVLRDLEHPRPVSLLMTAGLSGAAFLAYEIAGLMVITFFILLVRTNGLALFRRWEAWAGAGLFLALIGPDIYVNLSQPSAELSYEGFLGKFDGVGFNPTYLEMYFPNTIRAVYPMLTGVPFPTSGEEYRPLNDAFGLLVLAGLIWHVRQRQALPLIAVFLFVFMTFTFIEVSPGSYGALWLWVSVTLIPGSVLAGALVARRGSGTFVFRMLLAMAAVFSLGNLVFFNFGYARVAIGVNPLYLEAADGSMIPVATYVESCDLCSHDVSMELKGISALRQGIGTEPVPESDVSGADLGSDDRAFALRVAGDASPGDWARRIYAADYDLWVEGQYLGPFRALAAVRAEGSQIPPRAAPFWGEGDYLP